MNYRKTLTLIVGMLAGSCHPGVDPPGVPLYPNGATARLPPEQIAQVIGPLAKVDGQEVGDQGGRFDLLPGCHVIELERRIAGQGYALTGAAYVSGQYPTTVYALHMKPGARYVIRRDVDANDMGPNVRVTLSAQEVDATGRVTELAPAASPAEIRDCK